MVGADASSLMWSLLALNVAALAAFAAVRCVSVAVFRHGAEPYGVGPCGVARVTVPLSRGLVVTERT